MNKLEIVALQEIKKNINDTSSYLYPVKHFHSDLSKQISKTERDIIEINTLLMSSKDGVVNEKLQEETHKLLETIVQRQRTILHELYKVEESVETALRKNTKAQSFLDAIIDDNKVG